MPDVPIAFHRLPRSEETNREQLANNGTDCLLVAGANSL